MRLQQLHIKNFRCFEQKTVQFSGSVVLIDGLNGSGKTSIIEALHYLCYLRSFRTHSAQELVRLNSEGFFLKAVFSVDTPDGDQETMELQVGYADKQRSVKINQKPINSYKELLDHYRIVTLTEQDLLLVQGAPEERRTFIDMLLLLHDPHFATAARNLRTIAYNRTKLLQGEVVNKTMYNILTEQLWHASRAVQECRQEVLVLLQAETNKILATYFNESIEINFGYQMKKAKKSQTLDQFLNDNPMLYDDEKRLGRSMFGAHLDDFLITFQEKKSRTFASRGQQKLIVLLLKIAQMRILSAKKGSAIFLLDDFMTDFDEQRAQILLKVLSEINNQVIFTSPLAGGPFHDALLALGSGVTLPAL